MPTMNRTRIRRSLTMRRLINSPVMGKKAEAEKISRSKIMIVSGIIISHMGNQNHIERAIAGNRAILAAIHRKKITSPGFMWF